jgi:hypothetical protein
MFMIFCTSGCFESMFLRGTRYCHALLLTARELLRESIDLLAQADHLQQVDRLRVGFLTVQTLHAHGASVTFRRMLMYGNRLKCWKTMPILLRT